MLVPQFLPDDIVSSGQPKSDQTAAADTAAEAAAPATNQGHADGSVAVTGTCSELDFGAFLESLQSAGAADLYAESLQWMERHLLTKVLSATEGNQSRAAEMLGITRGSLRNKIRSLNISVEHVVSAGD